MAETFASWAVVELMGHRRIVGKCEEVEMCGSKLLRVDVPRLDGQAAFSQFYGGNAIYCMTPVTEEVAMAMLQRTRPEPWFAYEMPRAIEKPDDNPFTPPDDDEDEQPF